MARPGFVYIMASGRNGTLYLGSTSNLVQRAYQHREGLIDGFTKRYRCQSLVWFDPTGSIAEARHRELQMKKWKRLWKLSEIEAMNPHWADLYETLF